MDKILLKLTVFFEEPFWVGVFEIFSDGKLEVCKIIFRAEPKDYEIYDFILKNWSELKFSLPIAENIGIEKRINPKRMQRQIRSQLSQGGVGTKSWQALKLQHEQNKKERKSLICQRKEAENQRQFEL